MRASERECLRKLSGNLRRRCLENSKHHIGTWEENHLLNAPFLSGVILLDGLGKF